MYRFICTYTSIERAAHVEKFVSMQHSFEEFLEKKRQRRVKLKSVGNFVAKTVLVEYAN